MGANNGKHQIKNSGGKKGRKSEPAEEYKLNIHSDSAEDKAGVTVRKKKKPRLKKGVVIPVAVIIVLAAAAALFVNSKLDKIGTGAGSDMSPYVVLSEVPGADDDYQPNIDKREKRDSGSELPEGDLESDKNIVNILLMGTDMKLNDGYDKGRCDATLIMSLNKKTGNINLISFERAVGVPVPVQGGRMDDKICDVLKYGGPELMVDIIEKCFLVDIDGYVKVGYETFPMVIDAIGGIDMELSKNEMYFMNRYLEYKDSPELVIGMNHLNGIATYSYCRLRDIDGDYARQGRVRNAIAAVVDKLKTMSILQWNDLADKVLPLIETDLSKKQLTSLILSSPKFMSPEISQMMVPESEEAGWSYQNGNDDYLVGVDYEEFSKEIKEFIKH